MVALSTLEGLTARTEFPIPTNFEVRPTNIVLCHTNFGIFDGFLALERNIISFAMQNCHIYRHFGIQILVLYKSIAEHPVNEPDFPTNFF